MVFPVIFLIFVIIIIILWIVDRNYSFMLLILTLYIAQLFILVPGSDASAASYGAYNTILFYGMTLSAWASISIIIFCLVNILFFRSTNYQLTKLDILCIFSLGSFLFTGMLVSNNFLDSVETPVKLSLPFIIYYYARFCIPKSRISYFYTLFLLINLITVGQVFICKILTGSFAINTFYWYIMSEEYFGYYNSPHPFSALLGLLSLWCIKSINERKRVVLNAILLSFNLLLIFLSGVRTYALGITIALIFIMISAFRDKGLRNIRKLLLAVPIIALVLTIFTPSFVSLSRFSNVFLSGDMTSSRLERWTTDVSYYVNQKNIFTLLLGNGFQSMNVINQTLIGVYINSLNVFIDLLVENGAIGMLLYLLPCVFIWKECYKKNSRSISIVIGMTIYIVIGLVINNLLPYVTIMPLFILILVIIDLENQVENGKQKSEYFGITSSSVSYNSRK